MHSLSYPPVSALLELDWIEHWQNMEMFRLEKRRPSRKGVEGKIMINKCNGVLSGKRSKCSLRYNHTQLSLRAEVEFRY